MKPTIKSSIPLTFFRFSAAIILFLIAGAFLSHYLTTHRDPGRYEFVSAQISSDGKVTYFATRANVVVGRIISYWEFDETLLHPRLTNEMWFDSGLTGSVLRNKRRSRVVRLIQRYMLVAKRSAIWWNEPAGQVDWYDFASRMRVASLGPVGPAVKAPARPEERFDGADIFQSDNAVYLLAPQGVYELLVRPNDFKTRLVYKGSYEGFDLLFGEYDYSEGRRLLIVHGNTLSVFDAAGSLLRDIKLPEIAVTLFKERFKIRLFDNGRVAMDGSRKTTNEKTILLFADDGSLIRRVDYDTSEINKAMNGGVDRADILFPTLMPPIPVPGLMEKSALVQSIVLSLVFAAVVLWRQMRLGRRGARRAAWVAFTLVFGLLGFITYLAAYRDRRSEPCPDCRRPRLVAEDLCPHCDSRWPAPKPLGIEIVETA